MVFESGSDHVDEQHGPLLRLDESASAHWIGESLASTRVHRVREIADPHPIGACRGRHCVDLTRQPWWGTRIQMDSLRFDRHEVNCAMRRFSLSYTVMSAPMSELTAKM